MITRLLTKIDGELVLAPLDGQTLTANILIITYSGDVISSIEFTDKRGYYTVGIILTLNTDMKNICSVYKHGLVVGLVSDTDTGRYIANNFLGKTINDDRIISLGEQLNKYCNIIYDSGIIRSMEDFKNI